MKKGLLLINLGTPDSAEIGSVRRYLREFLVDKRVITLPAMIRYVLVNCLIIPFRARQSTHAYQSIWTTNGSPLLVNSLTLKNKVQQLLGDEYIVSLGMRYGNPSIQVALDSLKNCSSITVLPLYPQYSSAATGSSIEKVLRLLLAREVFPTLHILRDFHHQPDFIQAQVSLIEPHIEQHDYILFSYHGVPENHLIRGGCETICQTECPSTKIRDNGCYRAQCFETTRLIAQELQLKPNQYGSAFQSRLGKTPWIKPYTDETLPQLAQQGIRRLAIACPSFVSDCLETLEEIGIRAQEQWQQLGGEQLTLVPCLNDSEQWSQAICNMIRAF